MTQIRFEEPPPRRGGRAATRPDPVELEIAEALVHRPGEWALVEKFDAQSDALLLQRRIGRGAPGSAWSAGFEATVRKMDHRMYHVYARHVGEDAASA